MVRLETENTWSYYNGEIRNRILGAITMVSLETENTWSYYNGALRNREYLKLLQW
jgi:hypothetical protein